MIEGTSLSFAPLLPWPLLGGARARGARGLRLRPVAAGARHPVARRDAGARPARARQPGGDPRAARGARRHRARAGRPLALADRGRAARSSSSRRSRSCAPSSATLAGLEVVEATTGGDGKDGTRLFETLDNSLLEIDRARLAGVLVLSDGQVHDVPDEPRAARHRRAAPPAADRRARRARPAPAGRAGAELRAWSATSRRSRCGSTSCRTAAAASRSS